MRTPNPTYQLLAAAGYLCLENKSLDRNAAAKRKRETSPAVLSEMEVRGAQGQSESLLYAAVIRKDAK
jgi:hypothetical protein